MTIGVFDHPVLGGLLGDDEITAHFAISSEIAAMLRFEVSLARAEARAGVIPAGAAERIAGAATSFAPDIGKLRGAVAIDGIMVPEFIRQLREKVGEPAAQRVHFGATSQDVIDTGLMLRLKPALALLDSRLGSLGKAMAALGGRDGANSLTAMTRMQPAITISAGDRITAWLSPLERSRDRLAGFRQNGLVVQFGGAAGTLDSLGAASLPVRVALAAELGLADAPPWHSQRDRLADLASILSLITGSLGKFGQDVALMAQAGAEIELKGGGRSSTMAHKRNPVAAEILVTLARFNATLLGGMHNALVHEQERSGSAWALEWMLLPQMLCATGAALRLGLELTDAIARLGAVMPAPSQQT
ncbi:3-carboxy-cis,cis-muconate cycloisomerase [Taklimakanibacter lacteus]|uniref:3-carboxy-cis,cis-muconate cycloisomerase n=1 Tax=Taklimakanibacter lacteus TaxID=2268456 RepID=UPI000E673EF0